MNADFRSRVLMPIVLPIIVLLVMITFIGAVAAVLLFNTHQVALIIAAIAAAGILFTISLAASQDRLSGPQRGVVVFAAAMPIVLGALVAGGVIGSISDEDRNINAEPLVVIPEDVPLIAAENSVEFCLIDTLDDTSCEPTDAWAPEPTDASEPVVFNFNNRENGIPHNVVITQLAEGAEGPEAGELILETEVVTGPTVNTYSNEGDLIWTDLPAEWYFFCQVHPNMQGVGEVVVE